MHEIYNTAIVQAGWDLHHQVREQKTFTDGRIIVRGKTVKRGEKKRSDYILYYKSNLPIAIIEAKDNKHEVGAGMQQALDYAETLDIPFVFSSNGDAFVFHDKTNNSGNIETELTLEQFPTPADLYKKFMAFKGLSLEQEEQFAQEYFYTPNGKSPRYYQENAINRAVEAVLKGQNRILLTMATGTGKTYTAFQIMWRLWRSRAKKRILFLADRNILVDDPMRRDFAPFKDKMIKLKRGSFDIQKYTAYEIFVGIYQSATGTEEDQKIFKQFPNDFFDLIVVDECHRGSAKADSAWREILTHYSSATQIGMTATPKETNTISNTEYFGDPIYTYSLKQGIEDGFLAPYKVIRVTIDKDVEGYRPTTGKADKYGYEVEDREYNIKDFDRNIVIDERTELVALKITEFLKATDRYSKTIVFCVDIDHAERMRRALINANSDVYNENRKYIVRITGDSEEGKNELDNFIDPEKKYPVIVTTSKLLTTGVDAKTCKLIVLDTNISSMVEFKQIIGRGTRIDAEYQKYFFTIMDFRQATKLFADPDFDGDPVRIKEITDGELITDNVVNDSEDTEIGTIAPNDYDVKGEVLIDSGNTVARDGNVAEYESDNWKPKKYYVNGVDVSVINETVQFYDENGKLTTECITDYSKKNIMKKYRTMDIFLKEWKEADKKTVIIEELENQGVLFDELQKEIGKNMDPFDLILHVAYQKPALSRKERALHVKKRNYFEKYGENAKNVLNALLEKYADQGIESIENLEVLKVPPLVEFGTPIEIVNFFGGKEAYLNALQEMEQLIYVDSYADSYSNKSIQDIMRKDTGVDGDAQRISQLVWMLFLKIFDDKEKEYELLNSNYKSPIPEALRWRNWAVDDAGVTGDDLIEFVNNKLFKGLKELQFQEGDDVRGYIVKQVFEDAYNYMKSGTLMRQVINKIDNEMDFTKREETHVFNDIYEKILKGLQSAGNAGEYYTPRAVTKFIVEMVDPKLGEKVLDPACGTGGFLVDTIELIRKKYVKTAEDEKVLQESVFGIEKKPLPHMLCTTNLILHGFEVPKNIKHDNTLARPLRDYSSKDKVDVIVTNPPFGGIEEEGIDKGFPKQYQTKETADLFLVLITELLKDGGRAGIVLPDGSLTGDGVKVRIREKLLNECNLHTIVRLPNSVFAPYASLATNLLFFTKGTPTKEIWYYEHRLPEEQKAYSKTRPIKFDEFNQLKKWWNSRELSEYSWNVSINELKDRNYDIDIKNPSKKKVVNNHTSIELIEELEKSFEESLRILKGIREDL